MEDDEKVQAQALTYGDLAKEYPKLKISFDSFTLPIVIVETDDLDLIEGMFSRLNEAVPLNAAEKRNAIGGPMAKLIVEVTDHVFFKENVKFSNKRYQHREVATRLLFLEHSLLYNNRIIDTKKPWLDDSVRQYKNRLDLNAELIGKKTISILGVMKNIFTKNDELLLSQSAVPLYYLLFRDAIAINKQNQISRRKLLDFRKALESNRKVAEKDITKANFDLLEFDRMSQQGTNDASSIKNRLRILGEYLGIKEVIKEEVN